MTGWLDPKGTDDCDSGDTPDRRCAGVPDDRTCPYQLSRGAFALRDDERSVRLVTLFDGRTAWVATTYDSARQLLTDPRMSSDRSRDDFPRTSPRGVGFRNRNRSLISLDPPEHSPARRMLIGEFTVQRVKQMRGDIERIVHSVIDDMLAAGPTADLVTQFSLPVPSMMISQLLGVPYADHPFFNEAAMRLTQAPDEAGALAARDELAGYLDGLITTIQAQPRPGLLNGLITQRLATGEVDRDDLVASAILLLIAGHDTTASMTSLAVITLLAHPDQLAALRADPTLAPGAVEELLRYLSAADVVGARIATADIEIDGVVIRAGDGVIIPNSIANRDGSVFADPDTFDIRRPARHHIAFGYGIHQCLGQNLARVELDVIITALFDRIPTLRLAVPVEALTLRPGTTVQGVNALPVTW